MTLKTTDIIFVGCLTLLVIKNSIVNYAYDGQNILSSFTCIDHEESVAKESTATFLIALIHYAVDKSSRWTNIYKFILNFSNHKTKELIIKPILFNDIIFTIFGKNVKL